MTVPCNSVHALKVKDPTHGGKCVKCCGLFVVLHSSFQNMDGVDFIYNSGLDLFMPLSSIILPFFHPLPFLLSSFIPYSSMCPYVYTLKHSCYAFFLCSSFLSSILPIHFPFSSTLKLFDHFLYFFIHSFLSFPH